VREDGGEPGLVRGDGEDAGEDRDGPKARERVRGLRVVDDKQVPLAARAPRRARVGRPRVRVPRRRRGRRAAVRERPEVVRGEETLDDARDVLCHRVGCREDARAELVEQLRVHRPRHLRLERRAHAHEAPAARLRHLLQAARTFSAPRG
jgi:hypothetical protein